MASSSEILDSRLVVGGVYLITYFLNTDASDGFHWGLYHHTTPLGGHKYHIKNMGQGWIADHAPTHGVLKSAFLVMVLRIGSADPDTDEVKNLAESIPITGPPSGYDTSTCRTWTLSVTKLLIQKGIVHCPDVSLLEEEVNALASRYHGDATNNIQPRPILDSSTCGLK